MRFFVFGKKPEIKEGFCVFARKQNGDYNNIIFGVITGVDGNKIGVTGLEVNPVGLKNKLEQGKAGSRSQEILRNPTAENCIFTLIYRIEQKNFSGVLDLEKDRVEMISPKAYAVLDGWIRESLPELINNILSLSPGSERDRAKQILGNKMDTLLDKNLKKNLYSICRSLKILAPINKNWYSST